MNQLHLKNISLSDTILSREMASADSAMTNDVAKKEFEAACGTLLELGFSKTHVKQVLKELLSVYGGDDGWPLIKENGYEVVLDRLLSLQDSTHPKENDMKLVHSDYSLRGRVTRKEKCSHDVDCKMHEVEKENFVIGNANAKRSCNEKNLNLRKVKWRECHGQNAQPVPILQPLTLEMEQSVVYSHQKGLWAKSGSSTLPLWFLSSSFYKDEGVQKVSSLQVILKKCCRDEPERIEHVSAVSEAEGWLQKQKAEETRNSLGIDMNPVNDCHMLVPDKDCDGGCLKNVLLGRSSQVKSAEVNSCSHISMEGTVPDIIDDASAMYESESPVSQETFISTQQACGLENSRSNSRNEIKFTKECSIRQPKEGSDAGPKGCLKADPLNNQFGANLCNIITARSPVSGLRTTEIPVFGDYHGSDARTELSENDSRQKLHSPNCRIGVRPDEKACCKDMMLDNLQDGNINESGKRKHSHECKVKTPSNAHVLASAKALNDEVSGQAVCCQIEKTPAMIDEQPKASILKLDIPRLSAFKLTRRRDGCPNPMFSRLQKLKQAVAKKNDLQNKEHAHQNEPSEQAQTSVKLQNKGSESRLTSEETEAHQRKPVPTATLKSNPMSFTSQKISEKDMKGPLNKEDVTQNAAPENAQASMKSQNGDPEHGWNWKKPKTEERRSISVCTLGIDPMFSDLHGVAKQHNGRNVDQNMPSEQVEETGKVKNPGPTCKRPVYGWISEDAETEEIGHSTCRTESDGMFSRAQMVKRAINLEDHLSKKPCILESSASRRIGKKERLLEENGQLLLPHVEKKDLAPSLDTGKTAIGREAQDSDGSQTPLQLSPELPPGFADLPPGFSLPANCKPSEKTEHLARETSSSAEEHQDQTISKNFQDLPPGFWGNPGQCMLNIDNLWMASRTSAEFGKHRTYQEERFQGMKRKKATPPDQVFVAGIPHGCVEIEDAIFRCVSDMLKGFQFRPIRTKIPRGVNAYGDHAFVTFSCEAVAAIFLDTYHANPSALSIHGKQLFAARSFHLMRQDAEFRKALDNSLKGSSWVPSQMLYLGNVPSDWHDEKKLASHISTMIGVTADFAVLSVYRFPTFPDVYIQMQSSTLADSILYKCMSNPDFLTEISPFLFICRNSEILPKAACIHDLVACNAV